MTNWHNPSLTEVQSEFNQRRTHTLVYYGAFIDVDSNQHFYDFECGLRVSGLRPLGDPPLVELELESSELVWAVAPVYDYQFELASPRSKAAHNAVSIPREYWPFDIQQLQERIEKGEAKTSLLPEQQTREQLIDPILNNAGWHTDKLKREHTFSYGSNKEGAKQFRADYILYVQHPLHSRIIAAVIEAKRESFPADYGLEQGKMYADILGENVKYVFATNGHEFVTYDRTRRIFIEAQPMAQFPQVSVLENQIKKIPEHQWRIDSDPRKSYAIPLNLDGDNKKNVAAVAQLLLPDISIRNQTFQFFADSVLFVNNISTGKWETTLSASGSFVRLNVGRIEVLAIFRNGIHVLLDETLLTEKESYQLGKYAWFSHGYKSVPESIIYNFRADALPIVKPLILESYHSLLTLAANSVKVNTGYRQYHSAGVIDYLEDVTGQKVPHPKYS